MADPLPDLIVLFTEWLATRLEISMDEKPFGLFAHAVEESGNNAADTVTVIRAYGGGTSSATTPTSIVPVQAFTRSPVAADAMARGAAIDAALRDEADQLPVINIPLNGGLLVHAVLNIRPHGMVGRDPKDRAEVAQNFELFYSRQ